MAQRLEKQLLRQLNEFTEHNASIPTRQIADLAMGEPFSKRARALLRVFVRKYVGNVPLRSLLNLYMSPVALDLNNFVLRPVTSGREEGGWCVLGSYGAPSSMKLLLSQPREEYISLSDLYDLFLDVQEMGVRWVSAPLAILEEGKDVLLLSQFHAESEEDFVNSFMPSSTVNIVDETEKKKFLVALILTLMAFYEKGVAFASLQFCVVRSRGTRGRNVFDVSDIWENLSVESSFQKGRDFLELSFVPLVLPTSLARAVDPEENFDLYAETLLSTLDERGTLFLSPAGFKESFVGGDERADLEKKFTFGQNSGDLRASHFELLFNDKLTSSVRSLKVGTLQSTFLFLKRWVQNLNPGSPSFLMLRGDGPLGLLAMLRDVGTSLAEKNLIDKDGPSWAQEILEEALGQLLSQMEKKPSLRREVRLLKSLVASLNSALGAGAIS